MSRIKHASVADDQMTIWIHAGLARLRAAIAMLVGAWRAPQSAAPLIPPLEVQARAAWLFNQALREDSNLALDWLWYAAQMADDTKRRYCVERALAIDPDHALARRALAALPPEAGADPAGLSQPADSPA